MIPAPQRQIPGLQPVPDNVVLSNLPLVDGINDIKDTLRCESLYVDVFLGTGYSTVGANRLEAKFNDGQVE